MVDDLKRVSRVFHDFAVTPVAASRMMIPKATFCSERRKETVATIAPNSTVAIMITPAREMVSTSAIAASAMARAQRGFSSLGMRELMAATNIGAVMQRNTDRLFESSMLPGTRWVP